MRLNIYHKIIYCVVFNVCYMRQLILLLAHMISWIFSCWFLHIGAFWKFVFQFSYSVPFRGINICLINNGMYSYLATSGMWLRKILTGSWLFLHDTSTADISILPAFLIWRCIAYGRSWLNFNKSDGSDLKLTTLWFTWEREFFRVRYLIWLRFHFIRAPKIIMNIWCLVLTVSKLFIWKRFM